MIDINEIKQKINVAFSKYNFHEESHTYTYRNKDNIEKTIGISTTQLIHSYSQPFDEDAMSEKIALRDGISKEDVLAKWANNRDIACEYGTLAHLYLECCWKDTLFLYDTRPFLKRFGFDIITPKFEEIKPALDRFYQIYKDRLILIGAEVTIASEKYDIAGSIDLLAYSKKLDAIIIMDNKSNKEIRKEAYKNATMLPPINHIPDCNFWHYSLQGAIYKKILESETGIKISSRKFLIWFDINKKDFEIIEQANLDKEAELILEERRKKNENFK